MDSEAPATERPRRILRVHGEPAVVTVHHLAEALLFTPLISEGDSVEARLQVLTLVHHRRRLVPTFTQRSFFSDWSADRYRSLTIIGSDLALALPPGVGLFVNPGQLEPCEISAREVDEMRAIEFNARGQRNYCETIPGSPSTNLLVSELSKALGQFTEVKEATLLTTSDHPTAGVLGLLTTPFHPERRSHLTELIREISRRFFGATSSIELFDEARTKTSGVWNIFHGIEPFYRGEGPGPTPHSTPAPDAHTRCSESPTPQRVSRSPKLRRGVLWRAP